MYFICDHMRSGEKLDPSVVINSGIRVGLSLDSLYISSSKIQGNTSDHYMNRVVFLMERSEVLSD